MSESTPEAICPACEVERRFAREVRLEEYSVRGESISIEVPLLVCSECGSTIVDDSECEDPVALAFDAYRDRRGLMSPEEIKALRLRYGMSQRSLAMLLGMSEATINRYEGGGLQDEPHDNMLRACLSEAYVADLVERRGHLLTALQRRRLVLGPAREESSDAVRRALEMVREHGVRSDGGPQVGPDGGPDQYTGFRVFDYQRYASVFAWFCVKSGPVFSTKINKLLFYADFLAYRTCGQSLTGARYAKLPYGPVPDRFRQLEARLEADQIFETEEVFYPNGTSGLQYRAGPRAGTLEGDFLPDERAVLEFVCERFRNEGAVAISERSHDELAYRETAARELISYHKASELSLVLPG